jgi:beta-N-acetylhexosaminidase
MLRIALTRAVPTVLLATLFFLPVDADAQQPGLRDAIGAPPRAGDEALPPPTPGETAAPIEAPTGIEALNLEQKVAQLMIVRLNGQLGPDNFDRQILRELAPGGVILPTLTRPQDTAMYVQSLRSFESETLRRIPFLIGVDVFTRQRAGQRVGEEPLPSYMQLPPLLTFAAAGDSGASQALFERVAQQLAAIGINFHVGPSLSVANRLNPASLSLDHLGSDYGAITSMANALNTAFTKHGVAWMPTGFPGGANHRVGDTLPTLLTPMGQLREADLRPYAAAMDAGLDLLNVGNVLAPTLDASGAPASLSAKVITDRLRGDLGYDGLVVVGPMDDRRLRMNVDPGEAALQALYAGADMMLWESNTPLMLKAIMRVVMAVQTGELEESVIDERVERVLAVKEKLGLLDRAIPEPKKVEGLLSERAKWTEPLALERRAVTLLRNREGILPLSNERSLPVGLTGILGVDELYGALEKELKQIGKQNLRTAAHTTRVENFELDRIRRRVKGMRVAVCLFSDEVSAQTQLDVLNMMRENGARTVAVLFGNPRNVAAFDVADAIVLVYSKPNESSASIAALAEVLLGNAPVDVLPGTHPIRRRAGESISFDMADVVRTPTGRLPVEVPGYFAGDSVSYRPDPKAVDVRWDFGDGKSARGAVVDYTYAKPGSYTVTLTVNPKGMSASTGTYEIVVE